MPIQTWVQYAWVRLQYKSHEEGIFLKKEGGTQGLVKTVCNCFEKFIDTAIFGTMDETEKHLRNHCKLLRLIGRIS